VVELQPQVILGMTTQLLFTCWSPDDTAYLVLCGKTSRWHCY